MITNETYPSLTTWAGYGNEFNIVGISEEKRDHPFNLVDGWLTADPCRGL